MANAEFKYLDNCYSVGKTLRLEAVYIGSGRPSLVQWSYSGGTGLNLMIKTSDCTVYGSVPNGFPAATRMEYMCPKKDSLPDNTYRLTVTGLTADELKQSWGATFTPPYGTVPAAVEKDIPVAADDSLSAGTIAGIVIGSVGGAVLLVGGAIPAYFKRKGDKDDTSRDVESTRSSPKKAESKLLNEEKQSSATGNADGGNKGKQFGDTHIHPNDKSQKVHPENEEKLFRSQPLPPPGAKLNHSLADDNHGTGAGDSFSLAKLPPIQKTPRTDKPN